MNHGLKRPVGARINVLKLAVLVCLLINSGRLFAVELDDILNQIRVEPPSKVAFREERFNPLLQEPMVLTGYLEYPERGHLVKFVEAPFQESMQVKGDQLEMTRDGKKRRLSLKNRKPLLVMLQSIESILSGRADLLIENFNTEVTGSPEAWELRLKPLSSRLARHLQSLTVNGNSQAVEGILFQMDNGDWQRLEILPTPQP